MLQIGFMAFCEVIMFVMSDSHINLSGYGGGRELPIIGWSGCAKERMDIRPNILTAVGNWVKS